MLIIVLVITNATVIINAVVILLSMVTRIVTVITGATDLRVLVNPPIDGNAVVTTYATDIII